MLHDAVLARPEDVWVRARRKLTRIRRKHREFDRFLRTLDYQPSDAEEPTGDRTFILCGSPRSGTTLASAQLFQPPSVVTVMEPWDGLRLPPRTLFDLIRDELVTSGTLSRGKLDVEQLHELGRVAWTDEGRSVELGPIGDDALIGIKWPTWWQYLEKLPGTRFVVCLRHPYEVIGSYVRSGGRLVEGSDYPVTMNRALNAEVASASWVLAVRRARLYEAINRRILPHLERPNVYALRYERWHGDSDNLRRELSAFLDVELGPWPAKIERPGARVVSVRTAAIIERHAPVARDLGYAP